MQREHTKMFVCLFREGSVDVLDAERSHQDVCLFVQRGQRGGCGCRESAPGPGGCSGEEGARGAGCR